MVLSDRGRALEEGWFTANEKELLAAARARREARLAAEASAAREAERKAHYMKCPKCGHDLEEIDLSGVKVDRCGACEGFFMDAGEFEQLAERNLNERRGILRRMLGL